MEKFLEIILNPYCFLVVSALLIMGITQLIKLIPCFKNNNWNISFPIILGFGAAFAWGFLTKVNIEENVQILITFGTGIATLSTTLYGILKKIFSKNYKMENSIEKSELYSFLKSFLSADLTGFKDKSTTEKYGFIVSVATNIKNVLNAMKDKDQDTVKKEVAEVLSKFVNGGDVTKSVENLMEILKKDYNIPEVKKEEKKDELVKPE